MWTELRPKLIYTVYPIAPIAGLMGAISLGWGVQSWTLAMMSVRGVLPKVKLIMHSDTGYEREKTYDFIKTHGHLITESGIKFVEVRQHNPIVNKYGGTFIPAYTGDAKTPGKLPQQCTQNWKIMPLRQVLRREMRARKVEMVAGAVELWIGISSDEFLRAKPSPKSYITHRFPLLELGMSRQDCLDWLRDEHLPVPPKSSCVFCPYHDKAAWQEMKREAGQDYQTALKVDRQIRDLLPPHPLYVNRYRIDLSEFPMGGPGDSTPTPFIDTSDGDICDSGHCFI